MLIFNKSLSSGVFPTQCKDAFIFPNPKFGPENDISNYRPIAILNVISKIFDKIVTQLLSASLINKLAIQQHGFFKGRFTITNLIVNCDFITSSIKTSKQIDTLNFDFSKTFDLVSHQLLADKIWNIGIRGPLFEWLMSYLVGSIICRKNSRRRVF